MRGADGAGPKRDDGKCATSINDRTNGEKPPRGPRRSRPNSSRTKGGAHRIRKAAGQPIQLEIGDSEEGKRDVGVGTLRVVSVWDRH